MLITLSFPHPNSSVVIGLGVTGAGYIKPRRPQRLLVCIGLASKWSNFSNWKPRHDMSSVGHSKPIKVIRCPEGKHGSHKRIEVHVRRAVSCHGWACRLCSHLWYAVRICTVPRDWSVWGNRWNLVQPRHRRAVCWGRGPHLWKLDWV